MIDIWWRGGLSWLKQCRFVLDSSRSRSTGEARRTLLLLLLSSYRLSLSFSIFLKTDPRNNNHDINVFIIINRIITMGNQCTTKKDSNEKVNTGVYYSHSLKQKKIPLKKWGINLTCGFNYKLIPELRATLQTNNMYRERGWRKRRN